MAGRSPYNTQFPPSSHLSQPSQYTHEPKASFDDLIDEYAAPYSINSSHQTYNLNTSLQSPDHRRNPSLPLSQKLQFSVKQDDDMSQEHLTAGYPPPPSTKQAEPPSLLRKLIPESMACKLYVLTVLIETTIDLVIEGELLIRVQQENENSNNIISTRKMPVYLSIFAIAHVFQLILAVDAVYARNTLQFIALTIFNAQLLLYSIIQITEIRQTVEGTVTGISDIPINVLTTIIPIVIGVAELAYIGLGWKIYHEFGWKVYKFLGADRRIKKMYANYQIYECLVKFDVFFWAGFSVQFIWLVLQDTDWEYYVTIAALPLSLVLLVEGHLAARHESKWMMATFMSGCVGAMVYFVYKLVKVLMYKDGEYEAVWKSLTVFSVIAIMLLLVTFVFSIMVMKNFGRGLKESLKRRDTTHVRTQSKNPRKIPGTLNPNRMSID